MLTHPTINQLRELKLDGMADAFAELQTQDRAKDLGHAEWLALLLDREAASRNTKRAQSRLRAARLRHGQASIEDVDYLALHCSRCVGTADRDRRNGHPAGTGLGDRAILPATRL